MVLAAGRILDIEFNEIKSGYRIRYDYNKRLVYVDVFLFDSLSSGAGYCATLSEQTSKLLKETEKVLEYCPKMCDSACHDCLQHFWNQRVHTQLDRFAGLELLKWCKNSALAAPLTYRQQDELLKPLGRLSPRYQISRDGTNHYVESNGKKTRIYVYPAMWNKYSKSIPQGTIAVSDRSIKDFGESIGKRFDGADSLYIGNILQKKSFELKTPETKITTDPETALRIRTEKIGGVTYILVPAGESVTVNGVEISVKTAE
jgi:hypothetical protein